MRDVQYTQLPGEPTELRHHYGDNVHILQTPVLTTLMARVSSPATMQPTVGRLTQQMYRQLIVAASNREFPRVVVQRDTRMRRATDRGTYHGEILDPEIRAVSVDIVRGGIVASAVCFEALLDILDPKRVRQDHIVMNRRTDAEGQVVGVDVSGSKIGGNKDGCFVLFPDPMGATGGSLCTAISIYKDQVEGRARGYMSLNLVVTPEFIRRVTQTHPDVVIYAARLDRGMSPPEVLQTVPGERWDEERGLNEVDYIVPGAGGFGEVLNNAEY